MKSIAASHARGKVYTDKLFVTGMAARNATAKFGREQVIDASLGVIADDGGEIVCLPTVEKLFRTIPIQEIVGYSPVAGLPDYRKSVIEHTFGESKPNAHIRVAATAGGAGALANGIWNYYEAGDSVLTHDWYWPPYNTICSEIGRKLETYPLFNEKMEFHTKAFAEKVKGLLEKQNSLITIINSPNHNPTGYSITDREWDEILTVLIEKANNKKTVTLLVDIAYIDFSDDPKKARSFMKKFEGLPTNVFVMLAFSLSKSFTVYGQRTGALIGISSKKSVIEEFENVILVTNRARWSNINRGCMNIFIEIQNDENLRNQIGIERNGYLQLIKNRARTFTNEAAHVGLEVLPYHGGFFITIPCKDSEKVCERLIKENIFVGPLSKGIRVAVCSVPEAQMKKLAVKVKDAIGEMDK